MASSGQKERELLWVVNNEDSGKGSLRAAIEAGNKFVNQGKAVEIAFRDNYTIKPKQKTDYHQYTIEGGDWLINDRSTKNITIDGSGQKDLDRYRSLFGINSPGDIGVDEQTRVDITRINLINNKVAGGATKGSGGSLGAGAAVLHWGGHLIWRDSVFQNNKVSGGLGTSGAAGGKGWYRYKHLSSGFEGRPNGHGIKNGGFNGQSAGNPIGINSLPLKPEKTGEKWVDGTRIRFGGNNMTGNRGVGGMFSLTSPAGFVGGMYGSPGRNGRLVGEAGQGGGGGGGGGVRYTSQYYQSSKPNDWGKGGIGGRGGDGTYGAGGGAGGGGGGNAGTNKLEWKFLVSSFNTSRTPNWSPSKPGVGGTGGDWATNGTSGSKPSRQNAGAGGKGGDGAALGTFTSFALDDSNSSLKLDNVYFSQNEADGGNNVGRFRDLFSRELVVNYRDLALSSGDQLRGRDHDESPTIEKFNADHTQTDKSKIYDISGRFLAASPYASQLISSGSYTKSANGVIATKKFIIDPAEDSVISLRVYHDKLFTHQGEIVGADNLLEAVNRITNHVYKTPTEAEIRGTRQSTQTLYRGTENTGSLTDGVSAAYAKELGFAVGGLATEDGFLSKFLSTDTITALSYAGPAIGVGGMIFEAIFTRIEEDDRIEKELASKRAIDKEKSEIQGLVSKPISMAPFKLIDEQSFDIFEGFKFGRDQIIFDKRIRPTFDEYSPDGSVFIKATDKGSGIADNSAKVIAQLNLPPADNLMISGTGNSNIKYLNSLLHVLEFGEGENKEARYVLSKDTTWKYLWTNLPEYRPIAGFANDRIVIDRKQGGSGLGDKVPLSISTFKGNDRVLGDRGVNIIHAGDGNDYIAPGLGEDSVFGGDGFDTIDYNVNIDNPTPVSVVAQSDSDVWNVTDINGQKSIDSSLSNVESLRVPGGSSIDLSNAKSPTAIMSSVVDKSDDSVSNPSSTSESNESSNHESQLAGQRAYLIVTLAGGCFTGSDHNDVVFIDVTDSDLSPDNIQETTVKGEAGTNELLIKGFAHHIKEEPDGKNYFFEVSRSTSDGNDGKVFSIVKDDADKTLSRNKILTYEDIANFAIVDILSDSGDRNRIIYSTYTPSADATTSACVSTSIGTDTGSDSGADTVPSASAYDLIEMIPVDDSVGSQIPIIPPTQFDSLDDEVVSDKREEYEFRVLADADRYFSGQQRFGDNNLISGDRSGNLLFGTRGKDKIKSRGGADTIIAGNGNDIIRSGGGKDIIDGGRGTNRVFGGKGRDGFHLRQNGHQIISDFQIGKDYFILNRFMDPHDFKFEDNGRSIVSNGSVIATVDWT